MNKNQIEKLMDTLLVISALIIFAGSLLKLQHFQYGDLIFMIGIISGLGLSYIEISRLKKIIKILKKKTLISELDEA